MFFRRLRLWSVWILTLIVGVVIAQADACPALVTEALEAVDTFCEDTGRNQACYGNVQLEAEPNTGVADFAFEQVGDIVDVNEILTLQLSAMDVGNDIWGVALMRLQADIPDTLPGQNVTFIMFGDVTIENAADEEQNPMQVFFLRTGVGDAACDEAPESGLLIQTPEGVEEVAFNVNGVDVAVGSTVLFQTEATDEQELEMLISTVEGSAVANFDEEQYPAIEGTQIRIPLGQNLVPLARPPLPVSYDENRIRGLPLASLPRPVVPAPPLPAADLQNLQERIQGRQALCGVNGLPPCENVLPRLRDGANLPPPDRWGVLFMPGENCALRPAEGQLPQTIPVPAGQVNLPFCPPSQGAQRIALGRRLGTPQTRSDLGIIPTIDSSRVNDRDGDGIVDANDRCPNQAGPAQTAGCLPDSEGDGIVDSQDQCPGAVGPAQSGGCPPSDSDGDGIADFQDQCPNAAGPVATGGCPRLATDDTASSDGNNNDSSQTQTQPTNTPLDNTSAGGTPGANTLVDRDGDGVPNADDECPDRAGPANNLGCPIG